MTLDTTSLERLVPDAIDASDTLNRESLELHVARYRFAAQHAIGPRVLDIASGAGYGTRILADETRDAREVVGVDVDADAVRYAQSRYASEQMRYVCGDAMSFRAALVTSSTAVLNASSFILDGFVYPLTLRTNCSAEARTSSSVAGGSKLNKGLMFRHM